MRITAWPKFFGIPILLPAAVIAVLGYYRRWTTEDAFITFRVVKQFTAGNGPVFNAGERIEASTSTLWTWLLALADISLPFRLEFIALFLGLSFAVCGVAMLAHFGLGIASRSSGVTGSASRVVYLPLGLLVLCTLEPFWEYATSGLETGLCTAWLGGCAVALFSQPRHRSGQLLTAALLGLGPLIRPDFALFSAVFILALILSNKLKLRTVVLIFLSAGALPVLYQIFRAGYYGALVPNTGLAKEAARFLPARGADFFWNLAEPYMLLVPLSCALFIFVQVFSQVKDTSSRIMLLSLPIGGVLHLGYMIAIGGGYMHGRLLLPGLTAILAPVSVIAVSFPQSWKRLSMQTLMFLTASTMMVWLIWANVFADRKPDKADSFLFLDEHMNMLAKAGVPNPVTIDSYSKASSYKLAKQIVRDFGPHKDMLITGTGRNHRKFNAKLGAGRVVAVRFIGILGYATPLEIHVVDLLSLADPVGSRIKLEKSSGTAGHEKPQPIEWVIARFAKPNPLDDAAVIEARERLACPANRNLLSAVQDPLTIRRFIENLWQSPRLTAMKTGSTRELFPCKS